MPANGAPPLDWTGFIGTFCLVLVLLGFALYLVRRGLGGSARGTQPRIEVIETRVLGSRQRLMLIRVDDREALVGVTPQSICSLMSWESKLPSASGTAETGSPVELTAAARLLARFSESRR